MAGFIISKGKKPKKLSAKPSKRKKKKRKKKKNQGTELNLNNTSDSLFSLDFEYISINIFNRSWIRLERVPRTTILKYSDYIRSQ